MMRSLLILAAILCLFGACDNKQELKKKKYIAEGMVLYRNHCQNCHQTNGTGFEKLIPPLTDTLYLRLNRDRLACIIRYGMDEAITINGQVYNQPMVPNEKLTDMEIAEILTYITNAFGNSQEMFTIREVRLALQSCGEAGVESEAGIESNAGIQP
ncbi:mono/diheme cytochrome c family protein [Anseongella ginsenosidimutans]|uniref:Mono/diheme cytochrome c family protein n=1 Tax=Anseongella ginsenosidimutans TaxID=496056 RepID=A0A4R3KSW6_9SPHI|nr:cytochrome c [Anseongella ginsenosidimutans]QEC53259.1 cytochrome c [Anseongella ginsenosidimutans]TCS87896.1 mono/diheme cytochrome c family protein [Anseongella ginsenosidimutans]